MQRATAVALETVGCKLNQAETESLARRFLEAGYRLMAPDQCSDVYILNTCTVTHIADRKSRHLLRLAHRRSPGAFIVATGCYAQRAASEISQIDGVNLVIGNSGKDHLVELIQAEGFLPAKSPVQSYPFRTRSTLKIQDGCNQPCSYCIVPRTRGRERSVPIEQVIAEVKARVAEGYKEVILTGTQIGAYGELKELVQRILTETEVQRLRLSSLQPQDLSPSFIELWADERVCRHLHLPLQSGSDALLQRMGRRYLTADYERAVTLAREAVPELSITTDVMVGFPGESEAEFEESYRFCERIGFAAMHVFPYSPRPGTVAARMPDKVKPEIKKERSRRMLKLAQGMAQRFRERFLGQTMMVLWERRNGEHQEGFTDNYIRVFSSSSEPLSNQLLPVKLVASHGNGLWGEST